MCTWPIRWLNFLMEKYIYIFIFFVDKCHWRMCWRMPFFGELPVGLPEKQDDAGGGLEWDPPGLVVRGPVGSVHCATGSQEEKYGWLVLWPSWRERQNTVGRWRKREETAIGKYITEYILHSTCRYKNTSQNLEVFIVIIWFVNSWQYICILLWGFHPNQV